jgi:hypothetical protein
MEPARVEVGAVYRWSHDDRLVHVLAHDSGVVMYDAWWPDLETWGLAKLEEIKRQRISYYVTTVSALTEKATYLRTDPLTDHEVALHRPDLPLSVGQSEVMQWPAEVYETAAHLVARSRAPGSLEVGEDATFDATEVVLYPFGPNGGQRAGVRVKADNGIAFTAGEFLWKAAAVQAPYIGEVAPTRGVGIYRSGLHRGIPSYYLWGSESKLHTHIASVGRR